jgi:hypothetical protein
MRFIVTDWLEYMANMGVAVRVHLSMLCISVEICLRNVLHCEISERHNYRLTYCIPEPSSLTARSAIDIFCRQECILKVARDPMMASCDRWR